MNDHHQLRVAYERHQQRHQALELVALLFKLQSDIQDLREISLSRIAHKTTDSSSIQALRQPIIKDLQRIQALREPYINENDWQALGLRWFTLQQTLGQVEAAACFESHNSMIRSLLQLTTHIMDKAPFAALPQHSQSLVKLYLKELPEVLEAISQIDAILRFEREGRQPAPTSILSEYKAHLARFVSQASRHLAYLYPVEDLPKTLALTDQPVEDQAPPRTPSGENLKVDCRMALQAFIHNGLGELQHLTEEELTTWIGGDKQTQAK